MYMFMNVCIRNNYVSNINFFKQIVLLVHTQCLTISDVLNGDGVIFFFQTLSSYTKWKDDRLHMIGIRSRTGH